MLYIHTTAPENCIMKVDYWFNRHKENSWFNTGLIKEIIKGIDKTEAVKDQYLESPIFGGMSPDRLSTGCKAVITMLVQNRPVYASCCGDDCASWILQVAEKKDAHIYLRHCLGFPDIFEAVFVETGVSISSYKEYVHEYYRIRHSR